MTIHLGDCLEVMRAMEDNSVDLVIGSPPYEDARTYGISFSLKKEEWVSWAVERYLECVRVCSGLVVWVVEGKTRNFQWSATPVLLMAELHKRGVKLRKPPIYHRVGIPGSGGPDWWRNDYEFCICSSKGKLPWSDNTATGHAPKYAPGGNPSHRMKNGTRISKLRQTATEPKALEFLAGKLPVGAKLHSKSNGKGMRTQVYVPPEKANPGNVITCKVGGGLLGSKLAHENEAPFPEALVEPFILSFCKPEGVVLDPFSGSGTTIKVAQKHGRKFVGIDIRPEMVELSTKRLLESSPVQV